MRELLAGDRSRLRAMLACVLLVEGGCAPCATLLECRADCQGRKAYACERLGQIEDREGQRCESTLATLYPSQCSMTNGAHRSIESAIEWYRRACGHGWQTACDSHERLNERRSQQKRQEMAAERKRAAAAEAEERRQDEAEEARLEAEHEQAERAKIEENKQRALDAADAAINRADADAAESQIKLATDAGARRDEIGSLRDRLHTLRAAIEARSRFGALLMAEAIDVGLLKPVSIRQYPAPDAAVIDTWGPEEVHQVALSGKWIGVARATLDRPPRLDDISGWVKRSDVSSAVEYDKFQEREQAGAAREQARRDREAARAKDAHDRQWHKQLSATVAPYLVRIAVEMRNPSEEQEGVFLRAMGFGRAVDYYHAKRALDEGPTEENLLRILRQVRAEFGTGQEGCLVLRSLIGVPLQTAEALFRLLLDAPAA